ncbi:FtsW/RodA/SpoVE family cell cycle protein [Vagococcus fluvialis]|uniref:Probable peptidoglycan glycosyltransferase FtsW n=2 Tax=Vagococcus fluvialis TaxID=2738 RepID=A0A369AQ97_9ENTE|nr:FtsW/RodA/SpoVE family cell cycle protein [Vagococcus fluvialis]MDR2276591.1 FtsW/RodA/SpoVE family cell cycle protein [Vagococcus sp.]MBO0428851.1 FtsW/RodA/SpoVE family cell cycle protein [Vagococcus fluvialis]MBO0444650.1 FtsW/RodA/SpoVE family cell cycle protein [Vagococcus fluvialis]MBO0480327.1 FtsW/RodA/SpoVE family cell cycle protein [Vagococcus fluvialis]MBO0484337.1 FtsW/RodA/SpoVE family cell cycle protein [Vagococcus fluvialis]
MPKRVKKKLYMDYGILIPYLILSILGIIMVYSASSPKLAMLGQNAGKDAIKQAGFFIVSLIGITFIYQMKTKVFQNKKFIMFAIGIISAMLILTKFSHLGQSGGGADGWLNIAGITLQPAEFLKIVIIWYLAYILSRRQEKINQNFKDAALKPLVLIGGLIFLVLIQPDNGGAVILALIAGIMVFASGVNYLYTAIAIGGGVVGSYLLIKFISFTGGAIFPGRFQYVYNRFRTFSDPFVDPLGDGHQMINSYFAMINGGWFGLGIGNSIQKKGYLSAAQTDFMFSIVIEELGLVMAIIILGILLFLILRIFRIGIKSKNTFNSMMCIGIAGMILIQAFINIGGITGIIPLTGVTFPFLSSGGSSLITLSVGIGFALNISADEKKKQYDAHNKRIHLEYTNQTLLDYPM